MRADPYFWVAGCPRPQGSKSRTKTGVLYEAAKGLKPWREAVALRALAAGWREPEEGDDPFFEVGLVFVLELPKRSKFEFPPEPDVDKLTRAILDALTGVCWRNDSRVQVAHVAKFWGAYAGVGVLVRRTEKPLLFEAPPTAAQALVALSLRI